MPRKSQYKHKLEYNNQYNRENYKSFSVRFNIKDEADIISFLKKKDGFKDYIKDLIQADMKKTKKTKSASSTKSSTGTSTKKKSTAKTTKKKA